MTLKLGKTEYWFVLIIPILNAITPLLISSDVKGVAFHFGYIRLFVLFLFGIYFWIVRFPINRVNLFVFGFMVYLLILLPFSPISFINVSRSTVTFFVSLIMLPIGYYYIKSVKDLARLNTSYMISAGIISIYLLYANIMGIGPSHYLADSFYTGNVSVNITKTLAAIMITTPVAFLLRERNKWVLAIVVIISIIFILIGLKRSALIASFLGLITYIALAPRKIYAIKLFLGSIIILALLSGLFWQTFTQRWAAREDAIDTAIDVRGAYDERADRMGEFVGVTELIINKPPGKILFGSGLFHIIGVFSRTSPRPLHVDYSVFLYGSGIIGLLLFLMVYYIAHSEKKKYYSIVKNNRLCRELNAVFYALIIMALILSIAGSWGTVGLRSHILLYMGAILGVIKETAKENYIVNQKNPI